jgi:hypothetical protein
MKHLMAIVAFEGVTCPVFPEPGRPSGVQQHKPRHDGGDNHGPYLKGRAT